MEHNGGGMSSLRYPRWWWWLLLLWLLQRSLWWLLLLVILPIVELVFCWRSVHTERVFWRLSLRPVERVAYPTPEKTLHFFHLNSFQMIYFSKFHLLIVDNSFIINLFNFNSFNINFFNFNSFKMIYFSEFH